MCILIDHLAGMLSKLSIARVEIVPLKWNPSSYLDGFCASRSHTRVSLSLAVSPYPKVSISILYLYFSGYFKNNIAAFHFYFILFRPLNYPDRGDKLACLHVTAMLLSENLRSIRSFICHIFRPVCSPFPRRLPYVYTVWSMENIRKYVRVCISSRMWDIMGLLYPILLHHLIYSMCLVSCHRNDSCGVIEQ